MAEHIASYMIGPSLLIKFQVFETCTPKTANNKNTVCFLHCFCKDTFKYIIIIIII